MVDFLFLLNALLALMASSACFYVQRKILSADHTMQNSSTAYIHFKKTKMHSMQLGLKISGMELAFLSAWQCGHSLNYTPMAKVFEWKLFAVT